jgi:tyrosyl-tRNA synthetase
LEAKVKPVREQLKIISQEVEEILPLEDLREKLERAVATGLPLRIKYGVDPTAPDLHLGHAVPLRKLRQFQNLGHEVILLIGDFTARIGDPSERSTTRPQLPPEIIKENARTYTDQAFKILDRNKTTIEYNSNWFTKMSFEDVLKLAAQFTVARLLERDDFANRYAQEIPIGLHEFLYPIMQGYDSVALKSDVELGGTDQKFNMLAGRDLQKYFGQEPQVVITLPILEGVDGIRRMSKSQGNYIGLTEPPEEMFGKVMSIPDSIMIRYFKLATYVPEDEIRKIEKGLREKSLHPAEVKRYLAREIVTIYHGEKAAEQAQKVFDAKFKKVPDKTAIERLAAVEGFEIPEVALPKQLFEGERIWVIKILRYCGLVKTNSEGRRLIQQRAVRINDELVTSADLDMKISDGDIIQVGKRRLVRLRIGN